MSLAAYGGEALQPRLAERRHAQSVEVGEGDVAQGGGCALSVDQLILIVGVTVRFWWPRGRPDFGFWISGAMAERSIATGARAVSMRVF